MRGIGTSEARGGNENSVAIYVDGVYYASANSSILSLTNIEQIAVLKGPQGTLFGRNATGGLIQITTLDPKHDFGGRVSASYGTKDTVGASLYVTGGLSDQLAADLAVSYDNQGDGFGRNLFNGREVNKSENLSIRSKWKLDIGDATTLKLSGDYANFKDAGPARRPVSGSIPATGIPFRGGRFDIDSNYQPSYENKQGGGSFELTHHFDSFDVISLTAYRKSTANVSFDSDGTPARIIQADIRFKDRQFSQEFQAVSTGGGPFRWTAGLYYFYAKGGYDRTVLELPPAIRIFQGYQRTKSPAAYAQGTYQITDATSLTLGGRYSIETRRLDANGTIFAKATSITMTPPALSDKLTNKRPTWRIALDHRLSQDVLVYASYNRGFKSGGYNATTFTPAPEFFDPEKLDAYEVGIKSDLLDKRLRVNAAGYYYDYGNIQLASIVGGLQQISNAASSEIYGFDADITAQPTDALTLTAGFSYIHSRFLKYPTAVISTPLPAGGNALTVGDASGNKLPFAPDWTINFGLDYVVQLGQGSLKFSTQYFHSDGWFSDPDNRLKQNPYDLINASLNWSLAEDGGLGLTAWVKNLTNEVYAATLQTQSPGDIIVPAAGRTMGLTVSYKF